MTHSNAVLSSWPEKKKRKKQKRRNNALEDNDGDHDISGGTSSMKNTSLKRDSYHQPPDNTSLMTDCETAQCSAVLNSWQEKKKRKNQKRRNNALENNDIDNNLLEGTSSMKDTPVERDLYLNPPVNICLKMDSEMARYKAEVSTSREYKKGKKQKKRHIALENNDIEGGDMPRPDLTNIKHKENVNTVSVVAELDSMSIKKNLEVPMVSSPVPENFSSFQKSSDTNSMKKRDNHAKVDVISLEGRSMKTYRRKKQVKTYHRKRRKSSNSVGNSLEPIKEEGSSSSMQVVQNSSTRETSFSRSDEALTSGLSENKLEKELVRPHGTSLQVVEDISLEQDSSNCSDGEPASDETKNRIKMKNLKETINADSFVKDVSVQDLPVEHFGQGNRGKPNKIKNAVRDGVSIKENFDTSTAYCKEDKASDDASGCDPSRKHLEQNVEIQTKMEEIISSSSHLGVIKDDVSLVVNKENRPPQKMHSSPERTLIGRSRRKLLILDVNGLLADIVPYVPDGYKADLTIAKKAVFKRPFCDDFLQFCFEIFDVGVWSSRIKRNVDRVLDFLMGDAKQKLLFCWDQFHCTDTGYNTIENRNKPLVLKELKKLWEKLEPDLPWEKGDYNESNTLLLDDSPYKALRNPPHTAVFPYTYRYKDIKDNSLGPGGDLRVYLEGLALAENVQKYVEQNPFGQRAITKSNLSWRFYVKLIGSDSYQSEDDASNSCSMNPEIFPQTDSCSK